METRRKNSYKPQSGKMKPATVRATFGGNQTGFTDPFGGLVKKQVIKKQVSNTKNESGNKTNRPASSPGVTVKSYPLKPIKKDPFFPF